MRRALIAAFVIALACVPAQAQDAEEPVYADKPASWWVREVVDNGRDRAALEVVQSMGAGAVPALTRELEAARDANSRMILLRLLLRTKAAARPALPAVRRSLSSNKYYIEVALALGVMSGVGADAAPAIDDVLPLLHHKKITVRWAAIRAICNMGDAAARYAPRIAAILEDPDASTREAALLGLMQLRVGSEDVLAKIDALVAREGIGAIALRTRSRLAPDDDVTLRMHLAAADSEDERLQQELRTSLGYNLPVGRALLRAATELSTRPDPTLQSECAAGLGRWAQVNEAIPDALLALLASPETAVCARAAYALRTNADAARAHMDRVEQAFVAAPNPMTLTPLMRALGPDSAPALMRAAVADSAPLRLAAWHAIARMRGAALTAPPDILRRALLDLRVPAQERRRLLQTLDWKSVKAAPEFRPVLLDLALEADSSIAESSIDILCRTEGSIDGLLVVLERDDTNIVTFAILQLRRSRRSQEPAVRAAVLRALEDPRLDVRKSALSATIWFGRRATGGLIPRFRREPVEFPLTAAQRRAIWRAAAEDRVQAPHALRYLLFPQGSTREVPSEQLEWLIAEEGTWAFVLDRASRGGLIGDAALRDLTAAADQTVAMRASGIWIQRGGGKDVVLPRILAALDSEDDRDRQDALFAVSVLSDEDVVKIGGKFLKILDARGLLSSPGVVGVLVRVAPWAPDARDAVLALAADPNHPAHSAAAGTVLEFGGAGHDAFLKYLNSPARAARRNALVSLMQHAINGNAAVGFAYEKLEEIATGDDLELAGIAKDALKRLHR